jgi:hypothetical protein
MFLIVFCSRSTRGDFRCDKGAQLVSAEGI